MNSIVITRPGGPEVLQIQERAFPVPAANEVLIKVYAAGVNRPDVFQRKGNYPPPAWAPQDIPGLEVAGIVVSCGPAVYGWKTGDKVCALVAGGGYAEYVIAHAGHCLPVPEGMDFTQAATLPETVFTVWHNVFQRGALQSGERFLVHGGSGGIGITAIQMAHLFGAKVFATAGTDEKCQACIAMGADHCVNYKVDGFESAFQEEGVDVILDMVGGTYIPKNIRLLRNDGRLVFINTVQGSKTDQVDFSLIMRKRLTITGSTLRNRTHEFKAALTREIREKVWPMMNSGAFRTVIYRQFPLSEAAQAHALMESSSHIGKIVLVNEWPGNGDQASFVSEFQYRES
jgi:NADPH2:quinone reductase